MRKVEKTERLVVNINQAAFKPFVIDGQAIKGQSFLQLDDSFPEGTGFHIYRMAPGSSSQPHEHTSHEQFLVLEGEERQHRAEHFLLGDFCAGRHMPEQRGREVEAAGRCVRMHRAARQHRDPRLLRRIHHARHARLLLRVDQRAEVEIGVMRTGDELCETFGEFGRNTLVGRGFDQDAAAGRAGLAAVLDHRVDEHRQRLVDIGVGEDDLRRLAAEFHRDAAVVKRGGLLDLFLLQKAAYELCYEAANRPAWVDLPLRGLAELVDRLVRVEAPAV